MASSKITGQSPFVFTYCDDLRPLPPKAIASETQLHGGFAVDERPAHGHIYYGMPGCGLMRVSPDLTAQEIIELPPELAATNFHGTTISDFDGKRCLFLPANAEEMVAVVTLDGEVDFILPRPELDQYSQDGVAYCPTDTVLSDGHLIVADGYGANYISTAHLATQQWTGVFGGKGDSTEAQGLFGTAHGISHTPHNHLAIADRPHSRIEIHTHAGEFVASHHLPVGSRPCGIDYRQKGDQWVAVVGSLDDPEPGRPAPVYIVDGESYEVLSIIRPKEDLGIDRADHIHNVIWHEHNGHTFLICQSWNPGFYFVLQHQPTL